MWWRNLCNLEYLNCCTGGKQKPSYCRPSSHSLRFDRWNGPDLDSKVLMANMGPTWVLSAPYGPLLVPWTLLSGDIATNWQGRDVWLKGLSVISHIQLPCCVVLWPVYTAGIFIYKTFFVTVFYCHKFPFYIYVKVNLGTFGPWGVCYIYLTYVDQLICHIIQM